MELVIFEGAPEWAHELRRDVTQLKRDMEYVMSQIDDLNAGLEAIETDVDAALAHVTELETELTQAQAAGQPTDLTAALSKVALIRSRLESVSDTTATTSQTAADVAAAQPQPEVQA